MIVIVSESRPAREPVALQFFLRGDFRVALAERRGTSVDLRGFAFRRFPAIGLFVERFALRLIRQRFGNIRCAGA